VANSGTPEVDTATQGIDLKIIILLWQVYVGILLVILDRRFSVGRGTWVHLDCDARRGGLGDVVKLPCEPNGHRRHRRGTAERAPADDGTRRRPVPSAQGIPGLESRFQRRGYC
jgi:hypothetical protein